MREPVRVLPSEIDTIPDQPGVFLLWAAEGQPYLARTSLLRRRLKRLVSDRDRASRLLNLRGVADHIDYWPTGSQIEAALIHLSLAQEHFPDDWPRLTRLRPPALVRLTLDNPFPRTMITTRLGRGLHFGPFASRAAAEHFQNATLDLFQIRRCEENLAPSPDHPGCIYGEMARCIRPCQMAVSVDEYRSEAQRVEQFLRTGGASLVESAESARDRASADMQFEEAERLHQRVEKIHDVVGLAGDLARSMDHLNGVAAAPSVRKDSVELWFMLGGRWVESRTLELAEAAGVSMDHRLKEMTGALPAPTTPSAEHLSILLRWYGSSWRDGEWVAFDSIERFPYRKLVNAIGRVHKRQAGS
jgi:excinuclease UvrABC nuclease subunit